MSTAKQIGFVIKQLSDITSKIFYRKASKDTPYPYVVFNFPSNNPLGSNAEGAILEMDIWNKEKPNYDALTETENLADLIENKLKDIRHLDDDFLFIFTKLNRLSPPDEDQDIERRRLRFLVKTYNR